MSLIMLSGLTILSIFVFMRKLILLLLLVLSLSAFAQHDSAPAIPAYDTVYYGGFEGDKLCTKERLRAITENKLYYIDPTIYAPRYRKYMQTCCNPYHLTYYFIPEDVLGLTGFNPMRCYIAAIDSVIKARFGNTIKTIIAAKADSLFFANIANDTIDIKYCTRQANLWNIENENIFIGAHGEIFHFICPDTLYNKFKQLTNPAAEPVMLMSILIEANGRVSQYKLNYFESDGDIFYADTLKHGKVYDACGLEFLQLAITALQQFTSESSPLYEHWQPALIYEEHVRTWHSIEVIFSEAKKN